MKSIASLYPTFLSGLMIGLAYASAPPAPTCNNDINIPVSISAINKLIPTSLNTTTLQDVRNLTYYTDLLSLPDLPITGNYNIAASYCEPSVTNVSRADTLQILVHGVTYTREYWSALQEPGSDASFPGAEYSWINYAAAQGYPTLAIDRLCAGNSSHANGLLVCQIAANAATIYEVIEAARAGTIPGVGRAFSRIILVGHSGGSTIANVLAQQHPEAVDAYILTGYTPDLANGFVGAVAAIKPEPAAVAEPSKYGALPPSYFVSTDERGATSIFYYGNFSHAVSAFDYDTRHWDTVGLVSTALLGEAPVPEYTGRVLALTGEQDQIFCATSALDGLEGGYRGDCGVGPTSKTAQTKSLFPNAAVFQYAVIPNTGHDVNLHISAPQTFAASQQFLNSIDY